MAQVKIYGLADRLVKHREVLSEAIHGALMEAFELPREKRFQRFIPLDPENFLFPEDRSRDYTIIEISVFQGRSDAAKKALIRSIYTRAVQEAKLAPQDLEITLFETPKANWGIRGVPGDELTLNYKTDV